MKNRKEQPSAKQKAERELQNRNAQEMKNKTENRMESCNKDRSLQDNVKNTDSHARAEMRADAAMKNCHKEQ